MKDRQYNGQKIPKGKSVWYLLAIVLSVFHWFTASDFPFGIFWSLYCLYFIDLQLLISPLVSFGHCIVCISLIYSFWFPLWYLLVIVLSVFHWFTASDFPFGIFWPLYWLSFIRQTIQWPKDTNGEIRSCKSMKDRQYNGQKIPKGKSEAVNQWKTDNTMAKRYQRGNQKL
jgi:hypothetical protein